MGAPRDVRWTVWREYAGGLVMFAAEALIVLGLALVAWVLSIAILALL